MGKPRDDAARAVEILLSDEMMSGIARSARYRVRGNRPLFLEPPDSLAGRNLRFVDLVDYQSDRSVTAWIDLDEGQVTRLRCEPAASLGPAEEDDVISVALADRRVAAELSLGDEPQTIVRVGARPHRSAAIAFGAPHGAPSFVAVVDLARRAVTSIVPPELAES